MPVRVTVVADGWFSTSADGYCRVRVVRSAPVLSTPAHAVAVWRAGLIAAAAARVSARGAMDDYSTTFG